MRVIADRKNIQQRIKLLLNGIRFREVKIPKFDNDIPCLCWTSKRIREYVKERRHEGA